MTNNIMQKELELLRAKIEHLENLAAIYSDRDQVRMQELLNEIRANEMKLLDLMTSENIIC